MLFPESLKSSERAFLLINSSFYSGLSTFNKKYFEHRVIDFIESYEFVGRQNVTVTRQMKLLIAATAIKLTFGYSSYLFSQIDTIIVYPKDYFSLFGNRRHKGETNPKYRAVVFSWKDFEEGIKIEDDNLNLGLHEFTHAMQLSFLTNDNKDSRHFRKYYSKLLTFLKDKEEQKNLISKNYLRTYAFENEYEFLAVLIEHYFETPNEFKEKLPQIYGIVQSLLNFK